MRTSFLLGFCALAALGTGLAFGTGAGCSSSGGPGGSGGGMAITCAALPGEICTDAPPGQLTVRFTPNTAYLPACAADAGASCTTRQVKVTVGPDTCAPSGLHFTESGADAGTPLVTVPGDTEVSLHNDVVTLDLQAGAATGSATITVTATVPSSECPLYPSANPALKTCATNSDCAAPQPVCYQGVCAATTSATLNVVVLPAEVPTPCGGTAGMVMANGVPLASGGASVALQVGADAADSGSFLWGVQPFAATVACSAGAPLPGYIALGPAVTFGPESTSFPREIPLSIPINPGLMPGPARLRHLAVVYSGPAFKAPRVIPVADAHIAQVGGEWALTFKAPRLGTYQAMVPADAGTNTFLRSMTHRGVVGISMGGGGTASFGLRHHDMFDVVAPLGGPVDWTWMLDYIAKNHLGGFRSIPSGTTLKDIQLASASCTTGADCASDETCVGVLPASSGTGGGSGAMPGKCRLMPAVTDTYAHPQTYNTWWYEYPKTGNGGTFSRQTYAQLFRDLAIMFGNPNGENLTPGGENLPAGVPPTDPSVVGTEGGTTCAITVDPICPIGPDGVVPDTCSQLAVQQNDVTACAAERCAHTLTLSNYFDGNYNPDGIFPVITVCDGSPQNPALTPYANTWTATGDTYPLEVGLAVDYNGNGVRDELEPIIQAGHEPWSDFGTDGIPSAQEPGYVAGVNDDPDGDDYNPQYNPGGTENDHRFQPGEPFLDVGLDGVANTKQQPPGGWAKPGDGYDVGEGDGVFTVSRGLQRFWDRDAHSIVRQMVDPSLVPGGVLDAAALARIDVWTDGGLRDLFNFDVDAQHLAGTFAARGRAVGYLTGFNQAPGLDPTQPVAGYDGTQVDFADLQGVVLQRYGEIDPSAADIADGSGQHVGTVAEIAARLESALYFMSSRWADRSELFLRVDPTAPQIANCTEGVVGASTTFTFPACNPIDAASGCDPSNLGPSRRRGPVGISLPPGYCSAYLEQIRYPVIYVLHGYGQTPQDLEPAIAIVQNLMNDTSHSASDRMAKAILVYVDGRCRTNEDGTSECLQGDFFGDSARTFFQNGTPGGTVVPGSQDETWWLELMAYMDANYRTLGSTQVSWTE